MQFPNWDKNKFVVSKLITAGDNEMCLLLGQAMPSETSFLGWMVSSLTTISSLIILVSASLIFFGAYHLVSNKKPVTSLASYLVLLPVPFLVSMCGWIYGSIGSLATIAASSNLVLTNQGIAGGLAASLLSVLFAILVTLPAYSVLAYGLIARDFRTPNQPAEAPSKASTPNAIGVNVFPTAQ